MTIQWGDPGKAAIGPLKTINISMAAPRENSSTLSPADASFTSSLPLTQTASIGATFTVQQSDLPTIAPGDVGTQYCAVVTISGQNPTAGAITSYSQSFKNGTALPSSTASLSVSANFYWTHIAYRYMGVQVGDVLNVQVYASATGLTYDYCHLIVYPTQVLPYKPGTILKDLTFSNYFSGPTLSNLPSGISNSTVYTSGYNLYLNASKLITLDTTGSTSFAAIAPYSVYGLIRAQYGDLSAVTAVQNNATTRYFARNVVPQTITYREVLR